MSADSKPNHPVFFSFLAILATTVAVIGLIISRSEAESDNATAVRQMEWISAQLIAENQTETANGGSPGAKNRAPASLTLADQGRIGTDPWGQPFYYRLLLDAKGRKSQVLLLSAGPDRERQTDLETTATSFKKWLGDDLGMIKPFPEQVAPVQSREDHIRVSSQLKESTDPAE